MYSCREFKELIGPNSGCAEPFCFERRTTALKTDRREVSGSILHRACQPSRSVVSVVFSETCINTG